MIDLSKQIAKESKSSFYYAFSLLKQPKRDAMNTVYAFCRKTDDIIDEGSDTDDLKYEKLRRWRIELEKSLRGTSEYPLLNKLSAIIKQFNIPLEPFFELIAGMEMDLQRKRYLSFEDLMQYCYLVASTVGLMCIEIFGYKNKSAKDYAVNLGLAMQLTNILRDVKKDSEKGRIYLPQKDLADFYYTENDLMNHKYDPNFVSLMKYEAARAEEFFDKANQSLDLDDKPAMFPARAMQHIYHKLLTKIEVENFDVFSKKIRVGTFDKLYISLGVWAKYNLVY
ncbi:MAG: presqualene diphosphate synthase HpnD [Bacteroidetes bacterium]|nr:presqualene diphosphate synthase HpnD [Bacteroidota bacterium]MCL6097073.1 presqualene diphosphate synthase HpnD [Bacteroidota bacterium]